MTTTATGKADADKPMEESAERLARPLLSLLRRAALPLFILISKEATPKLQMKH